MQQSINITISLTVEHMENIGKEMITKHEGNQNDSRSDMITIKTYIRKLLYVEFINKYEKSLRSPWNYCFLPFGKLRIIF